MATTYTDTNAAADALRALIARGVNRYVESLPDFARDFGADVEPTTPEPNLTLTEAQQTMLCLSCALPDCIGVENPACPIRQAQRALWRNRRRP